MASRMKWVIGLLFSVLLAGLSAPAPLYAKSPKVSAGAGQADKQRYIVVFKDPPLAAYDGRILMTPERDADSTRLPATANLFTGEKKLDVRSPRSRQYLQFLDERFDHFRGTATLELGRQLKTVHRYRNAVNGFATELNTDEVEALRKLPTVLEVRLDEVQRMETDSGPAWIGAKVIQDGNAGFTATGGEGVVVGIIDSGVNYAHPSFNDPGEGGAAGWDHVNPYGSELGLCSDAAVKCNDKLVGVYDFVTDDPSTPETEENNNGLDNTGHGSHVASTAAGNPQTVNASGKLLNIAGVAPNANIVSYRVCYLGDPGDSGCQTSAILKAIDQAITDQVDVINHSIGSDPFDPWRSGSSSRAFLNARAAGIFVATSAGNAGPNASTIGSPANAPWITAAGAATHDRVFGSLVRQLSGGATTPPSELLGASLTSGVSIRNIVYAG
ncbi:MAG: S8 family serine peptidase, partial [Gammaproteobacteria bacterium]